MERTSMAASAHPPEELWTLLQACAALLRTAAPPAAVALRAGAAVHAEAGDADAVAVLTHDGAAWAPAAGLAPAAREFLSLYLPLCAPRAGGALTLGHLGQSLDGCVATASGDSCFVNDCANIEHLHRLRALCDAVVVGGATAREDDPRLTTRLVPGPNPLRVAIDPRLELGPDLRMFTDGAAPTLLVCLRGARRRPGRAVELLEVAADAHGHPDLAAVLAALHARGCQRVLVEGGGVTVSRFLAAGLLDRLHIAVAPLLIGAGRAGLQVPARGALRDCLRPRHRVFRMGQDLLYDCDLRAAGAAADSPPGAPRLV
jgi:riboflavin-specific deaminase-like protein